MITVTFIRHGESTDNLKPVWAGWADAPLSNHGMTQAVALGQGFSNVRLTAIYASPLKRAHSTAQALQAAQQPPIPDLIVSPLLREQNFGIAEGQKWSSRFDSNMTLEEHIKRGIYPVLPGRVQKFPDGESLNDVQARTEQAIDEIVMPYVREGAKPGCQGAHIAIVSHGLAISELIAALMRKDATERVRDGGTYRGLYNTAWTRVQINIPPLMTGGAVDASASELPPLQIRVTHVNVKTHLDNVKRQPGGLGRTAYDPKQKDIRAFFGGGAPIATGTEGRSESNVHDEVDIETK
ncbi:phosphoglycerate mutase-like protein [Rickenella mellea]|uniref:Phosphoglycerate mutase-like protein n=1 Tax=Rickenella mellea TaxID=50990 RepID=A0A4Y7Q7C7_9AGAM|nr:phosphoglycerate mutase-like protein [Rickenella mellea]